MRAERRWRIAVVVVLLAAAAACAKRVVVIPPLPAVLAHPEFVYPTVPPALTTAAGADRVDLGWRYLQSDDLRNADFEFGAALRRTQTMYPALAGQGYVALARRDHDRAVKEFDAALRLESGYVPALVGRGQALLALQRDDEALASFEAAVAADASLADVRRRVEVLRFRNVQQLIEAARAAAAGGRLDEARLAYERALKSSPDSAFLHRDLGIVERRRGNADAALEHLRRAADLDSSDAATHTAIGELLEARQDYEGAETAYLAAAALDPSARLSERIAAVAERAREARLPAEFQAIPATTQITRGDLAALIGVRLEGLLRDVPPRQVVMTDTGGHWAARWIAPVARAGIIEPFENHTFQPRTRVRRGDLAQAVTQVVNLIAAGNPSLRERLTRRPAIADMSQGHLSYRAAATAVASGVMPLLDGDRFQVGRAVSGAEAVEVVARLRALADGARGAASP